ncbi:hypothetical protein SAMN02745857_03888 [Andreprevotia lacus DSM 23236]|jgi:hypothetical protein|uniref:Uncharacterized protein n=1 Tax=Andreprevotia lacus DSM 23236 TaxID=1121001 RepID=A0A1W1XZX2_9NEIS|nr:hypothetical protein [Andreprevotia lacus]SMC29519.1 hypothetical protein SAMN02745857_03888 [Andreprevotia lacus DSM 23236]
MASDSEDVAVADSGGWSKLIQGIIGNAANGYLYNRFGAISDGEKVYLKGDNGDLYPVGQPTPNSGGTATAKSMLPYIAIGGLALLVVVMVAR